MKKYIKNLKKLFVYQRLILLLNTIKEIKLTNFQIIFAAYAIIFSVFLLLSIPGLFNYEKKITEIENKISQDFKFYINNISEVKYRFIPAPHIIIKTSELSLSKDRNSKIADLNDIKIFLSLFELYNNQNIKIKKILLNKTNFYFKDNDFFIFNNHLHKNINKPIEIKNSNFFYVNKKNEVSTISPIKNLKYFIDLQNKEKKFKIKGKLFDINYNFNWNKNYQKPNFVESTIKFKNPNINILNHFEKKEENKISGKSKINFLDNKLNITFSKQNNLLKFETEKFNTIIKTDLYGEMELNPFYFDINLVLKKYDAISLIQNIFSYLYSIKNSVHENLNGKFNLRINNKNNKLLEKINFEFLTEEGKINILNSSVNLKKIGKIKFSNFEYIERIDKLNIKTNAELIISDQKQFYRRFQIPKENRINIDKIYFEIETNIDDGTFYLFNFNINTKKDAADENFVVENLSNYEVSNIQQLTKIIRDTFKSD